ncbi:kinase domain containing protein [Ceratobasidium theobromae]|uniref:Kinase domain containing protein n=1 Tax=Ceratobasidium theobromae TaxID=1582974 RepID=A0A5N5Q9L1_9AGAM|nr:kinase domain containing protein [Ceratobasidium theobromae]
MSRTRSARIDKLQLNILIDGDDPLTEFFRIRISRGAQFLDLRNAIRAAYKQEREGSLGHLILFKFNKPGEEYENAKFSRAMVLNLAHKVGSASGWPAGSDFDDSLIHIVARVKELVPRAIERKTVEPSDKTDSRMAKKRKLGQSGLISVTLNVIHSFS